VTLFSLAGLWTSTVQRSRKPYIQRGMLCGLCMESQKQKWQYISGLAVTAGQFLVLHNYGEFKSTICHCSNCRRPNPHKRDDWLSSLADWHCCDMMMHDIADHIISIIVKSIVIFDEHLEKSNVCHLIRYLVRYAQRSCRKSTVRFIVLVLGCWEL
jgi:hypothetical protein